MISYRALKKIIGETSLERKCRYLFGFALLVLIIASFWLYDYSTGRLIESQQVLAAQSLVKRILQLHHYRLFMALEQPATGDQIKLPDVSGDAVPESPSDIDTTSRAATLAHIRQILFDQMANSEPNYYAEKMWSLTNPANEFPENDSGFKARRIFLDEDSDQDEDWAIRTEDGKPRMLSYYSAIRLKGFCTKCHTPDGKIGDIASLRLEEFSTLDAAESPAASAVNPAPDSAAAVETGAMGTTAETGSKPRPPLMSIARIDLSLESVGDRDCHCISGDACRLCDRPVHHRKARPAFEGRQRRDCPRESEPARRDQHRGRIRRTWACLQSYVAAHDDRERRTTIPQ